MPDRLAGHAEADATARFAASHRAAHAHGGYRKAWGATLATIGLGTYLGEVGPKRDRGYETAVRAAALGGINVFDAAINYRHQRSERVVGEALRRLVEEGAVARDALFVSTKGGYIPFDADAPHPRQAIEREYVATGLLDAHSVVNGAHCLAPDFLEDQVRRSRDNLRLDTLDLYYVHNPETQLSVVDRDELRTRLVAAFQRLEEAVEEGTIRRYGIATWSGLRVPPGAPDHLSLVEVVDAAKEARAAVGEGPHHLEAVQAPLNLMMPEAVQRPTQPFPDGETVPLATACERLGLAFFTSASILQGRLTRDLPEALIDQVGIKGSHAQVALHATRSAPGITTALVGMSSRGHVDEAVELLAGHAPDATAVWERTSVPRSS